MSSPVQNVRENATGIFAILVLGLGFLLLFAGVSWFWMVWVVGFAVLLPLFAMIFGDETEYEGDYKERRRERRERRRERRRTRTRDDSDDSEPTESADTDPLVTLRNRYARGELSDEQFEAKLGDLLETETPEAAREHVDRTLTEKSR